MHWLECKLSIAQAKNEPLVLGIFGQILAFWQVPLQVVDALPTSLGYATEACNIETCDYSHKPLPAESSLEVV